MSHLASCHSTAEGGSHICRFKTKNIIEIFYSNELLGMVTMVSVQHAQELVYPWLTIQLIATGIT